MTDMEGRPFTRESATILVATNEIYAEALGLVNGQQITT